MARPDEMLGRLGGPLSVEERLSVLAGLVEWWWGATSADWGLPADQLEGARLPFPLRWWYQRFGRHEDLKGRQNRLLLPDEMWEEEGDEEGRDVGDGDGRRLVFYAENQSVYLWSTAAEGDDPRVWVRLNETGEPWEAEESSLSAFLIEAFLLEAVMCAPYRASAAGLDAGEFDAVAAAMAPVPLGRWRWPVYPHRFYVREGALMFGGPGGTFGGKRQWEVWVGAKEKMQMSFMRPFVTAGWDCHPTW
jgi:hypothetical protein